MPTDPTTNNTHALTEAERTTLAVAVHDTDVAGCACEPMYAAVERILAARADDAAAATDTACRCAPCPGRGNDGHGHTHCAECCMGTGVEAELDCPTHGYAPFNTAEDTGHDRDTVERVRALMDRAFIHAGENAIYVSDLRAALDGVDTDKDT